MKFQIEKDATFRHAIAVQSLMCLAWTKFGGYMTKLSSQKFHDLELAGEKNPDYESHLKSSLHHYQKWTKNDGKPAGYWMPYGCIVELCCSIHEHSRNRHSNPPVEHFDSNFTDVFTPDQIKFAHSVFSFLQICGYDSVIKSRPVELANTAQKIGFMLGGKRGDYRTYSIESSSPSFDIQIPERKSVLYPLESCYISAILFKLSQYSEFDRFVARYFSR